MSLSNIPASPSFYCDSKYDNIVKSLLERGFVRKDSIDSSVMLIWDNLAKIDFNSLPPEMIVNHLKNSHHWSNKAFFSYHMAACGREHSLLLPVHWSSSYQTIGRLVELLACETVYSAASLFLLDGSVTALSQAANLYTSLCRYFPPRASISPLFQELTMMFASPDANRDKISATMTKICEIQTWRKWSGSHNIWIIKPVGMSCGKGILVVQGFVESLKAVVSMGCKCIVQKYIERPLLIRNRKFDIRQWILVSNLDPLTIYGFSECYLRMTSQEYGLNDLNNPLIHLCNHSVQKSALNSEDDITSEGFMLRQGEFIQCLDDLFPGQDTFTRVVRPSIIRNCVSAVHSVKDKVDRFAKGFEWLGVDLMVTESLEVLLIEVNTSPDISSSTSITDRLVKSAVNGLWQVVLQTNECHKDFNSNVGAAVDNSNSVNNTDSVTCSDIGDKKGDCCDLNESCDSVGVSDGRWERWYPNTPPGNQDSGTHVFQVNRDVDSNKSSEFQQIMDSTPMQIAMKKREFGAVYSSCVPPDSQLAMEILRNVQIFDNSTIGDDEDEI